MAAARTNGKPHKSRSSRVLIATPGAGGAVALLTSELEAAADYARAEKSTATRRAYRTDFAIFRAWCAERQIESLPATPATVAVFLAWEARERCATIHAAPTPEPAPVPLAPPEPEPQVVVIETTEQLRTHLRAALLKRRASPVSIQTVP
jgi:hypothetical protein